MPVCIVAATPLELEPLIPFITDRQFHILITGVGAVSATYHLAQTLQQHKPSLVLQAGIAGSFDENIPLGQAVAVEKDRFADIGVMENAQWNDAFDMKLADPNDPPFSSGWLVNPFEQLLTCGLPRVNAITISEVTTHPQKITLLRNKYQPAIESMEGAALHYVCLLQGIPFLQLRTISNYVGERDKSRWQIKTAINNLADSIRSITKNIQ